MKHVMAFFAVIFLAGLIAGAVYVFNNPDGGILPVPTTESTTAPVTEDVYEGQEIIVDELEQEFPHIEPPNWLSLIMHDGDINGRSPVDRCHDYGGELTLDMICHRVNV